MALPDGLTEDELLAHGFVIDDGGTEARYRNSWHICAEVVGDGGSKHRSWATSHTLYATSAGKNCTKKPATSSLVC